LIGGVQNIAKIPELYKRIGFTFMMLAVYRVGSHIVTPGINPEVIKATFERMSGTIFALFNVFSGGALEQLSIFALGIMPYISASIIIQLLTIVVPQLEALRKEGEQGQRKITQYTRYGTVGLALFQGFLIARALEGGQFGEGAVIEPGWPFRLMCMITLTAGTSFIMWLGEQITERGIGNGISLIIFAGIVIGLPGAIAQLFEMVRTDQFSLLQALALVLFVVAITGVVVFVERGQRRIPIQHARRVVGRRVMQGGQSYFPLRINTANVIPPIFASSILMLPMSIGQMSNSQAVNDFMQDYLYAGGWAYNSLYVVLIIFFCFFYTAIVINPVDVADNIKRSGGFIPGIRPGKRTAEFIDHVLSRVTAIGAIYIAAICLVPVILSARFGIPFYFGGTALLIVVGVGLDLIGQIEAHLMSRQYEGFMGGGGRPRGKIGR
jgi:preprotein translocase subunit SecY